MKEKNTKHTTYNLGYHLVWRPQYCKAILTGEIAAGLETELRRLCQSNGWEISSLSIQPAQVHLFLSAPPAVAPSLIANTLKGASARTLFKQHPELKQELWGGHLWSRSFYVGSVGDMSEDGVRRSIEAQTHDEENLQVSLVSDQATRANLVVLSAALS
jgi:putative transposase